jgi:predicted TIM-barrel enzyme
MIPMSPRVKYWRERRRRGAPLFAAACASAAEAEAFLPLAPDLILYHPAFAPTDGGGDSLLASLAPAGNANEAAAAGLAGLPARCAPCPVAMGVCGSDPFLLRGPAFAAWRAAGLEGVANFPTLGLADGFFRAELEAAGIGLAAEIACLREAHAAGFFTIGFACSPQDAAAWAAAGCDALIAHLGLDPEYRPLALSAAREGWAEMAAAARSGGETGPLLLLHGDHLAGPAEAAAWKGLADAGCDGIFASGGPERAKSLRAMLA